MNILYALVAFSVVMIVMATLVVTLVEMVNSLRGIRKRHMRYMLGAVFDEYLWPQFGRLVGPPQDMLLRADENQPTIEEELRQPTESNVLVRLATYLDLWRNYAAKKDPAQAWKNRPTPWIGVAAWGLFVVLALMFSDYVFFFFVALVLNLWLIDLSRESERDNFSLWFGLNDRQIVLMKELDRLTNDKDDPTLSDQTRAQRATDLQTLISGNPKAADLYRKISHRRLFIDEIVNVAKALTADPARAKTTKQNQLSVVEFAAHLGRTQFGEAIRKVSAAQVKDARVKTEKMLDKLLDEMARRFDSIGRQSTENFRVLTRRWSVALAFVVALFANVDAVRLFSTFSADSELARKVDTVFSDRLEEMSRKEQELVTKLTELAANQLAADRQSEEQIKADIKAVEDRIKALKTQAQSTLSELTDLGVPVGWELFPLCGSATNIPVTIVDGEADYTHPDPRCQATVRGAAKSRIDWVSACKEGETSDNASRARFREFEKPTFNVQISYAAILDLLKSDEYVGGACFSEKDGTDTAADQAKADTTTGQTEADAATGQTKADTTTAQTKADTSSGQKEPDTPKTLVQRYIVEPIQLGVSTLGAHLQATGIWLDQRWKNGLRPWAFGVLLAGLLIGLGGPFWFDIYKRLSGVAQIARSLGMTVTKSRPTQPNAPNPETAHEPKDVKEAFITAQDVTAQINRYQDVLRGFDFQAELTETATEDEGLGDPPIRIPLDRSGDPTT